MALHVFSEPARRSAEPQSIENLAAAAAVLQFRRRALAAAGAGLRMALSHSLLEVGHGAVGSGAARCSLMEAARRRFTMIE